MKDKLMQRAIELSLKGKGKTSPNPMVGAVISKGGRIVGEGFHKAFGKAHAEVNAIKAAGEKAKGGALYVTLEPCCHQGKTPPCTKAVIKSGIKKVVVGIRDPNPLVSGKGVKELKSNGVQVLVGLLEKEIKKVNESYIKYITTGIPFVFIKVGMSLDGKIATVKRESKWITSEHSRKSVHKLREEVDAVMVGVGTLLKDNPNLTPRLSRRKKGPARIVVDSALRIPFEANLMENLRYFRTIILTTESSDVKKRKKVEAAGASVVVVPLKDGRVDLRAGVKELGKLGITSVMLEGGGDLNFSALKEGVVDKVLYFIAPKIIGGREAVSSVGGTGIDSLKDFFTVENASVSSVGPDFLIEGYLPATWRK
ncbi:MAG: bifunctional diaminohydroxyphosphoribosylaminopyrimidine deaminase/5-amino-6-(5-phosphoribosylamino)uracil reductase RibD [Nitrospinota bacterium]